MYRRVIMLLACVLLATPLVIACRGKKASPNPVLSGNFFPLVPNTVWVYRVKSKSRRMTYIVTDKAVGEKFVPSLNVKGQVVEEFYDFDRSGKRPIVYVIKNGYVSRLSGLNYSKDNIEAPAWGRSEEAEFMPAHLLPGLDWNGKIFPFGNTGGAFYINQSHHSYFERDAVVVPAGRFSGCIRIETHAVYEGGTYAGVGKQVQLTYEDWYAPNIGLVKTVLLEAGVREPEVERLELTLFTPAPKAVGEGIMPAKQASPAA
jgi:hypothetical protein